MTSDPPPCNQDTPPQASDWQKTTSAPGSSPGRDPRKRKAAGSSTVADAVLRKTLQGMARSSKKKASGRCALDNWLLTAVVHWSPETISRAQSSQRNSHCSLMVQNDPWLQQQGVFEEQQGRGKEGRWVGEVPRIDQRMVAWKVFPGKRDCCNYGAKVSCRA